MSNDVVNLISSLGGGFIAVAIANLFS